VRGPALHPDPRKALFAELAAGVLESRGELSEAERLALAQGVYEGMPEAATYLAKVEGPSYTTTDEEVAALAGVVGDEAVFEATVAVAFGAARRQIAAALTLLEESA
jgi:hypothetical protein